MKAKYGSAQIPDDIKAAVSIVESGLAEDGVEVTPIAW